MMILVKVVFSFNRGFFLAVAADRIARVFNMPFSDEAITFDISITFNKIWHAGLL